MRGKQYALRARAVCLLAAAGLLLGGCSLGGDSSGGEERVYGTPVDPSNFFRDEPDETASLSKEARIAKCLTSKGAAMYGSATCGWTAKQKESFGDGFQFINYVECNGREDFCRQKGVPGYPTWIVGPQMIVGFHPPDTLASMTGCN